MDAGHVCGGRLACLCGVFNSIINVSHCEALRSKCACIRASSLSLVCQRPIEISWPVKWRLVGVGPKLAVLAHFPHCMTIDELDN